MPTNQERLELRRRRIAASVPIFQGGFRPFFLASAIWAIVGLGIWLAILLFGATIDTIGDPLAMHRHEMLFGFVGAAIAGFALTAVPNWTGRLPIAGWPLALLFAGWALGRVLPFVLPPENLLLILIDGGFYLALAGILGREIVHGKNRNFPVVGVIGLLGAAGILDRLAMAGIVETGLGWKAAMALIVLLIAIIGGRIVPSFTRNWLAASGAKGPLPTQPGSFDKAVLGLTAMALLGWLALSPGIAGAILLAAAALANLVRLMRWQGGRCGANPLLWILHVGYLWVPVGLGLLAFAQIDLVPQTAGVHALAAGAMGTMILAVMTRASLGHTGRPLVAAPDIVAAYVLVTIAAVLRTMAALAIGDMRMMLMLAGAAWLGAFGLFLLRYGPILGARRVGDQPKGAGA